MKKILAVSVFLLFAVPQMGHSEDFDFYGLKFGMTKGGVASVAKTEKRLLPGTEKGVAIDFGRLIEKLEVFFDQKHRLYAIKAYYPGYDIPEKHEALILALEEKFKKPIESAHKDVKMEVSEMQNQVIVSLYSISIREAYIKSLKEGVLGNIK
ncbi:MAG: hypothetical protein PVI20_09730 [Desulfobacteraceae bacterium]|jgi:hypothetical protein